MYIRLKKVMILFMVMCTILVLTENMTITYEVQAAEVEAQQADDDTPVKGRRAANMLSQGYDIVFCIDNSESIWEYQTERDMAIRTMAHLASGLDVRMGGIYFGDQVYKTQSLVSMEDETGSGQILDEFLNMTETDANNRSTNLGMALETAQTLFDDQDTLRKRIVVVFTDGINEGYSSDSAYLQSADEQVREQIAQLEENYIDLYCVYYQNGENEGDYFAQAVNYFDDSNAYDGVRYQSASEVDQLSDLFAEIFYTMQDHMTYRSAEVDADGKISFYVPEAGIKEVKIYLHNSEKIQIETHNDSNNIEGFSSTIDYANAFITIKNPVTGNWTITVTGGNAAQTSGTIAYYADIYADIYLTSTEEEDEVVNRNDQVQVVVDFYDKEGNKIEVDENATISFILTSMTSAGTVVMPTAEMTYDGGSGYGEAFVIDNSGIYTINVWLQYEDLLNLRYVAAPVSIFEHEPVTYDQKGVFFSNQIDDEQMFSFGVSELYSDEENDTVEITGINQLKEKNPVRVVTEDDLVKVYAKKMGMVNFQLQVEDSTGMTALVTIKGFVFDKGMFKWLGLGALIGILLNIVMVKKEKHQHRSAKKKQTELLNLISSEKEKCETQIAWNHAVNDQGYLDFLRTVKDYFEENLSEEQQRELGVDVFLSEPEEQEEYQHWIKISETIEARKNRLVYYQSLVEKLSFTDVEADIAKVEEYRKKIYGNGTSVLDEYIDKCKRSADQMQERVNEAGQAYQDVIKIMDTPITCDLYIEWKNHIGGKKARIGKKKYIKGYYSLDDIMVSGPKGTMPLRNVYEDTLTEILVYGYQGPEGEAGLQLKGKIPFDVKLEGDDTARTLTEAVLLKGGRYYITLREYGRMSVRVM